MAFWPACAAMQGHSEPVLTCSHPSARPGQEDWNDRARIQVQGAEHQGGGDNGRADAYASQQTPQDESPEQDLLGDRRHHGQGLERQQKRCSGEDGLPPDFPGPQDVDIQAIHDQPIKESPCQAETQRSQRQQGRPGQGHPWAGQSQRPKRQWDCRTPMTRRPARPPPRGGVQQPRSRGRAHASGTAGLWTVLLKSRQTGPLRRGREQC